MFAKEKSMDEWHDLHGIVNDTPDEPKSDSDLTENAIAEPEVSETEKAAANDIAQSPDGQCSEELPKAKSKKPIIIASAAAAMMVIVALFIWFAVICHHDKWINPTCTAPSTCATCGETRGIPAGHKWASATCTKPKTCVRCGATDGKPLGHTFEDATCTAPKKCSVCNATEGDPVGHTPGEWEYSPIDFTKAQRVRTQKCTVCGEIANAETEDITSFVGNGAFMFTPKQFADRMDEQLDTVNSRLGTSYSAMPASISGLPMCVVLSGSRQLCAVGYVDSSGNSIYDQDASNVHKLLFTTIKGDSDDFTKVALAFLMAIDPTVAITDSTDMCISIADAGSNGDSYSSNGVEYLMTDRPQALIMARVG